MSRHGSTYICLVKRYNGGKVYRKHQSLITGRQLFGILPGFPQYSLHGRNMEDLE